MISIIKLANKFAVIKKMLLIRIHPSLESTHVKRQKWEVAYNSFYFNKYSKQNFSKCFVTLLLYLLYFYMLSIH